LRLDAHAQKPDKTLAQGFVLASVDGLGVLLEGGRQGRGKLSVLTPQSAAELPEAARQLLLQQLRHGNCSRQQKGLKACHKRMGD
jgi:hypothetical protein